MTPAHSGADLLRELHESRREIARLRAENQALCSKLGLRSSSAAARTEPPSSFTPTVPPTLKAFPEPDPLDK